jgi:hypothetical protein
MTKILKKMHSPREFAEPNEFIENVKVKHRQINYSLATSKNKER